MKNGTKLLIFNGKNDSAYALFNMIDMKLTNFFQWCFSQKSITLLVCVATGLRDCNPVCFYCSCTELWNFICSI